MQPSERQQDIIDLWTTTDKNILINAVAGSGKEQPIWCKVQTPKGKVEIGSLKIGDELFDIKGKKQIVEGVFPQGLKDYYKITFRDGSYTYCGLEHLWTVRKRASKTMKTLSLSQIMESGIRYDNGDPKYQIPLCSPVEYEEIPVKIDPYIIGLLIGDGSLTQKTPSLSFNIKEKEMMEEVQNILNYIRFNFKKTSENGLQTTLVSLDKESDNLENIFFTEIKKLGLNVKSCDKFIPKEYLYNSIENRKRLLQGLMDSDGHCVKNRTGITNTSKQLIEDIKELVQSLGGTAIEQYTDERKDNKCYTLNVKTFFCPFYKSIKRYNWKLSWKNPPSRYIYDIEKIGNCEQICIKVSSEDQLYLTDNFIVTHNTSTLLMLLEKCDKRTLFVAFNKAIQEDIQQKIDQRGLQQGKAMTLHSLGLLAIKNSGRRTVINNNKNWNIIKILQANKRPLFRTIPENEKQKVVFSLIDLNDTSRVLLTEDFDTISKFLIGMGKTLSDSNALPELWEEFIKLRNATYQENVIEIDFNDMIFLPIYFDLEIPVYPGYLMVDENCPL